MYLYILSLWPMLLAADYQRSTKLEFKPVTASLALPNAIGNPPSSEEVGSRQEVHSPTTGQRKIVNVRKGH